MTGISAVSQLAEAEPVPLGHIGAAIGRKGPPRRSADVLDHMLRRLLGSRGFWGIFVSAFGVRFCGHFR